MTYYVLNTVLYRTKSSQTKKIIGKHYYWHRQG